MLDIVFHNPTRAAHYLGTKPTNILLLFGAHKRTREKAKNVGAGVRPSVRFMKHFNNPYSRAMMIMPT
jgi:hypothetical protein